MAEETRNVNALLDSMLLKSMVALYVITTAVSVTGHAGHVTFSRSVLLHNVLTETNWGNSAIVDINRDGKADIVLDNGKWYEGSNWTPHTYCDLGLYNAREESTLWKKAIHDIDGDGELDICGWIRSGDQGHVWFKNPGPPYTGVWKNYLMIPSSAFGYPEGLEFVDVDGDGTIELLRYGHKNKTVDGIWIFAIPADPTQIWKGRQLSSSILSHGVAVGYINNDRRLDIAADFYWLERTPAGRYIEHKIPDRPPLKGNRPLQIADPLIYDVDNDGDNDIIWPRAHNYGIYWSESSGGAKPNFTLHEILPGPCTIHWPTYGDIDKDGDIDILGGHCNYQHGDPGQQDPPDIFWLELVRSGKSGIRWIKHELANDFNLGFGCSIGDVDNDGDLDLVAPGLSNSRGILSKYDVLLFKNESTR
jgi:hypothetical protein